MADKKLEKQIPNNVVPLSSAQCLSEGCKKKPSRAGFCDEHFLWFKEGLITKSGHRVPDFDKKFLCFQQRQQKKAA